MGNKRLVIVAIVAVVGMVALLFLKPPKGAEPLRVFVWSNYLPEDIQAEFTKATGIPLEVSYFSSNEELFAKFKAGATGYDIIQPSDYMVRQMSRLGMLAPIDHNLLTELPHLDDSFRNLPYDPGLKYSVPFTWGTSGIALNVSKIPVPPEGVSWKLIFESPDFKHTSVLDDMREVFGAALLWRGATQNSKDKAALDVARADIARIRPKIMMFTSEPKAQLLRGEVNIAQIYSPDGISASFEDPKIQYFIPKEGATLYTDNFAIPATSRRPREAHAFINFFLKPENAKDLFAKNHLATPNRTVKKMLPEAERNNENSYPPPNVMKRLHLLEDLGDTLPALNRMWTELKSS